MVGDLRVRRPQLPHATTSDRDPRRDLRDDRPAFRARPAPDRHAALGLLHDGRDGHRPRPSRLLALHGPGAPALRAGQPVRVGDPRATTHTSTTRSASCSSASTTTRRARRLRPRRAVRWTAAICVNEWLVRRATSCSTSSPTGPTPLATPTVDWSRTRAWGAGGYYCRLFLNVAGREPRGRGRRRPTTSALRDELIERARGARPATAGRSARACTGPRTL